MITAEVHSRNVPREFRVSNTAFYSMLAEARIGGCSIYKVFRSRAYHLQTLIDPSFQVSGKPLTRLIEVGVCDSVMAGLEQLVTDLDVLHECLGELIACAVLPEFVTV